MSILTRSVALLLLATSALGAQTTGVPFVNDLQMRLPPTYVPVGSGTVSCSTFVSTGATGTNTVAFDITHSATVTAASLCITVLGCTPCGFPFAPGATAACAGPNGTCTPLTNLWLSLNIGGPWPICAPGLVNPTGMVRWNFPLTWPIPNIHVQAAMLDPCSVPWGFKFSQAMGFN